MAEYSTPIGWRGLDSSGETEKHQQNSLPFGFE